MSTTLSEKVIDIIENSDLNSLPLEERKKIIKYNKEQQILTLWQVLNSYKEYTSPYFRKKLLKWLENCVSSYRQENEKGGARTRTITIEVPEKTGYMTGGIVVGSEPIFFDFDSNTISGVKINENGEVAYMIRLEKKGGAE